MKKLKDLDFKINIYMILRNNFCEDRLFYYNTEKHYLFYIIGVNLFIDIPRLFGF